MPTFHQRYVIRFYVVCTLIALCALFMILAERYIPRKIQPDVPLSAKETISFNFDLLDLGKYRIRIEGWVLKNGGPIRTYDLKLLFCSADGTYYTLPSQIIRRPDVTKYVNDGNNYDASGFQIFGLSPALLAHGPFKVFILYMNDGKHLLIDSGMTL